MGTAQQTDERDPDHTRGLLAAAITLAALALVAVIAVSRTKKRRPLKIADVRAAYEGLSPEEF